MLSSKRGEVYALERSTLERTEPNVSSLSVRVWADDGICRIRCRRKIHRDRYLDIFVIRFARLVFVRHTCSQREMQPVGTYAYERILSDKQASLSASVLSSLQSRVAPRLPNALNARRSREQIDFRPFEQVLEVDRSVHTRVHLRAVEQHLP